MKEVVVYKPYEWFIVEAFRNGTLFHFIGYIIIMFVALMSVLLLCENYKVRMFMRKNMNHDPIKYSAPLAVVVACTVGWFYLKYI